MYWVDQATGEISTSRRRSTEDRTWRKFPDALSASKDSANILWGNLYPLSRPFGTLEKVANAITDPTHKYLGGSEIVQAVQRLFEHITAIEAGKPRNFLPPLFRQVFPPTRTKKPAVKRAAKKKAPPPPEPEYRPGQKFRSIDDPSEIGLKIRRKPR
jgi:hypothetical protein